MEVARHGVPMARMPTQIAVDRRHDAATAHQVVRMLSNGPASPPEREADLGQGLDLDARRRALVSFARAVHDVTITAVLHELAAEAVRDVHAGPEAGGNAARL